MKNDKHIPNFKTPKGYFESFETRLFAKMEEEKLPQTAGFHTPDGYFETLDERILKTVRASEKPQKTLPLFPKMYFGYAAAIAAMLVMGLLLFNTENNGTMLNSPQLAAIDAYIEEGNLDLDLYELTLLIDDEDLAGASPNDLQLSETALEDYLLNTLDTETLINQQ